jgi:hypothetical protein
MNQLSCIGFGSDASVYSGYAQAAGDRLGNVDFIFENTGTKNAFIRVKEIAANGDITAVGDSISVVAGGKVSAPTFNLLSKRVGFFGSGVGGSTTVNISVVLTNKADLRGAQIDIVAAGRKGWGFDAGFNKKSTQKYWGQFPDETASPGSDGYGGESA